MVTKHITLAHGARRTVGCCALVCFQTESKEVLERYMFLNLFIPINITILKTRYPANAPSASKTGLIGSGMPIAAMKTINQSIGLPYSCSE